MPTMSTGITLVSGYAHKVRRTMFAQLKEKIKSGEITKKEVAYKTGILNKMLFEVLINKLQLEKHDAVRIRIEYDVSNGELVWNFDSIQIEVWKRSNELGEKGEKAVAELKNLVEQEQFMREAGYTLNKVGDTPLGEEIYAIERDGETVGAVKVMSLNDNAVVTGAILEPPRKIRAVIPASNLENAIPSLLSRGEEISEEDAKKIIEEVLAEAKTE